MMELYKRHSVDLFCVKGAMGCANSYIFKNGDRSIIIDCGTERHAVLITEVMKDQEIRKSEIAFIVCTHSHRDHCGGLAKLKELLPNAKIIVQHREADNLRNGQNKVLPPGTTFFTKIAVFVGNRTSFIKEWFSNYPKVDVDIEVRGELDLTDDINYPCVIYNLPGHTAGSLAIVFGDGNNKYACVGDTMFKPKKNSFFPIFCHDKFALMESWKKLLDLKINRFHPGHHKTKCSYISLEELKKEYKKYYPIVMKALDKQSLKEIDVDSDNESEEEIEDIEDYGERLSSEEFQI